jgi:hypothetical protein
MTIIQENPSFISNPNKQRKKSSTITRKINHLSNGKIGPLRKNNSDNKINSSDASTYDFNIVSNPTISKHQPDWQRLQTYSIKTPVNFIHLNKSNVVR